MPQQKIKKTRPELKRRRDMLARYQRYLPTLKLKQQQLQGSVLEVVRDHREAEAQVAAATRRIDEYRPLLADTAGLDVEALARPEEIQTGTRNVAGVTLPVFTGVRFPRPTYSLFATPPWVDRALADLRELTRRRAKADVLAEQERRLRRELTRITQRVNLFEKVMIPNTKEAIRVIRIQLGDEMTAGVVRAKIAKDKIGQSNKYSSGTAMVAEELPA